MGIKSINRSCYFYSCKCYYEIFIEVYKKKNKCQYFIMTLEDIESTVKHFSKLNSFFANSQNFKYISIK